MCNESELSRIFGRFAGREIALTDEDDPTISAMANAAERGGYTLRLVAEAARIEADYNPRRANVHLEKSTDGKWRVSSHYHLG